MDKKIALAISLIPNLKPNEQKTLAETCPDEGSLSALNLQVMQELQGAINLTKHRKDKWSSLNGRTLLNEADQLLQNLTKRKIELVHIFDEHYPPQLKEIYDPPFLLYYKGHFSTPTKPSLAVVGTRKPSLRGRQETSFFVRECCRNLSSIVSGLAVGIDGTAHKAALAEKSHTTAVLGSGFNYIYPAVHKALAAKIVDEGGLLLSEFHPDTPPHHYNFPGRNRIVSGLSRGTIVIEAPLKSGTLITADFALEQGRDLFIHASSLEDNNSGVSSLHEQGAIALRRGDDLLHLWNMSSLKTHRPKINSAPASLQEKQVGISHKQYDISSSIANDLWQEIHLDEDFLKNND